MKVLEEVKKQRLMAEAAKVLELSYRQAHRIRVRYKGEGDSGLVHQGRGRTPNNAIGDELKQKILRRYEEGYAGFRPTFWRRRSWPRRGWRSTTTRCGAGYERRGCGLGNEPVIPTGSGGSGGCISASWCSWMAAITIGSSNGGRTAA